MAHVQAHRSGGRLLLILRLLLVASMNAMASWARTLALGVVLTLTAVLLYWGAACDWLIPRNILG
jgi:hypothetical protein